MRELTRNKDCYCHGQGDRRPRQRGRRRHGRARARMRMFPPASCLFAQVDVGSPTPPSLPACPSCIIVLGTQFVKIRSVSENICHSSHFTSYTCQVRSTPYSELGRDLGDAVMVPRTVQLARPSVRDISLIVDDFVLSSGPEPARASRGTRASAVAGSTLLSSALLSPNPRLCSPEHGRLGVRRLQRQLRACSARQTRDRRAEYLNFHSGLAPGGRRAGRTCD